MDLDTITPIAQDYLKAIWSATEWGDPPITTKALAERMGTTASNVSDTLKRLAAQGLIQYQPYKPVTLTPQGAAYAIAMVRRHRLLESFLVTVLGYRWEEVHEEAERLEHAASEAMIERIDTLLDHPAADPHGDPIPTATGHLHRPADVIRLSHATPGSYTVARVSDADPHRLTRLREKNLVPGQALHITDRRRDGTITGRLDPPYGPIHLGPEETGAIWVTPTPGPLENHTSPAMQAKPCQKVTKGAPAA
ncbi:metal-dependent transcriptional regulator [Citricoccus sp.]|uniref:metal-dependent transcriptional regulator n=1 Tax=Citricoccus sp. TaxID=1978372 RepID=UPI00262F7764|nr:metal-dependent transcriptional regulator [Citricoccus sp.]HRO93954.1 metal-dependent transcriptional regulator [Citricoccus sp.]